MLEGLDGGRPWRWSGGGGQPKYEVSMVGGNMTCEGKKGRGMRRPVRSDSSEVRFVCDL